MNASTSRRRLGARARRAIAICASTSLALGGAAALTATPAGASTTVVYSSIPAAIPANVPSVGFEAYSLKEFGDQVDLASNATTLTKARVLLSSWGCESGNWNLNDCSTTPGATFSVPITFKVYS